jgi:hypothetical protein
VLVLFALASFVLIGAVGLGVDGSRVLEERRNAQSVVDHAALAAARASCGGASVTDAIAAGHASATLNHFPDSSPSIVVTITPQTSPEHTFRAEIKSTISNTFARVLGVNTFDVSVEAMAGGVGCSGSGSSGTGYSAFAGGDTCPGGSLQNIKISGNDHTVTGRMHTNGGVDHSGNRTAMTGMPNALTYVWPDGSGDGRSTFGGSGNTFVGPRLRQTAQELWPTGYAPTLMDGNTLWDAYKAVMVNGTNITESTFNNVTTDGVWYTENSSGVDVKDIRDGWKGVIVSKFGQIKLGIDLRGGVFSAPTTPPPGTPAGVVLVSGYAGEGQPCDKSGILRSGNTGTWEGTWWSPKSQVRISGERTTLNKGVITWALQLEGNYHVINGGGAGSPGVTPTTIVMLE